MHCQMVITITSRSALGRVRKFTAFMKEDKQPVSRPRKEEGMYSKDSTKYVDLQNDQIQFEVVILCSTTLLGHRHFCKYYANKYAHNDMPQLLVSSLLKVTLLHVFQLSLKSSGIFTSAPAVFSASASVISMSHCPGLMRIAKVA